MVYGPFQTSLISACYYVHETTQLQNVASPPFCCVSASTLKAQTLREQQGPAHLNQDKWVHVVVTEPHPAEPLVSDGAEGGVHAPVGNVQELTASFGWSYVPTIESFRLA